MGLKTVYRLALLYPLWSLIDTGREILEIREQYQDIARQSHYTVPLHFFNMSKV